MRPKAQQQCVKASLCPGDAHWRIDLNPLAIGINCTNILRNCSAKCMTLIIFNYKAATYQKGGYRIPADILCFKAILGSK